MENNSFSVFESLNIIKSGGTVFTIIKNEPSFFKYQNNKVFIFNNNSSFYVSIDDFIELYVLNTFYLYKDDNEDTVDVSRDIEYYSIDKLKK